jgi:hypothetical protein
MTQPFKAGLPVQRPPHDPNAHVVMTPQLRDWLAQKKAKAA